MITRWRSLKGPLGQALVGDAGRWLRSLADEFVISAGDLYRIDLCLEELIFNVANYSAAEYAGQPVELSVQIEGQRLAFVLTDPAAPFDPFSVPEPVKAATLEEMQIGGQGIHLVREFSNAYRYDRIDGKNRVELIFNLDESLDDSSRNVKVPRKTDRRCNPLPPVFPLVIDGVIINKDRRVQEDRRALGFLSWAQIFHNVPYAAAEKLIERLMVQDIAGEMLLMKPGDENDVVLVVLQGCLKVYLNQPGSGDFISIGPGGCVGEMSVIDKQPVSAYVVADPGTRLLVIDCTTFLDEFMAIPGVPRNLLSALSDRMRRSNEQIIKRMRQEIELEFVQRELDFAHSIQEGLLPKEPLFPDDPRLDCAGKMATAREVGGDFYDIFFLDEHHVFFVIADVCGKGLPAAMFMVRSIAALRAQSGDDGLSEDYASRLMARLNQQLCGYNEAQQFLTAFCGILNLDSLTVQYVNAGHNAPVLAIGNGPFHYLEEPINPFVGMVEGLAYRAGEVQLEPGSVLLLYTDGVTEAENKEGNMLGDDCLLAQMNAVSDRTSTHLVETVFANVRDFANGAKQSDDITVLAIRCP